MSDVVSERWGDEDFTSKLESAFWMNTPLIQGILNRRATDEASVDWVSWLMETWVHWAEGRKCLVLGCGPGWLERAVASRGVFAEVHAQDVSAPAVAQAARVAREEGLEIEYSVSDLNSARLPSNEYDVVLAHSVVHHVDRLEHHLDEVWNCLRPDGVLVVNEYVGQNYLQYTERQLQLVNGLLDALPQRLRKSVLTEDHLQERLRPDLETLKREDPSESVRALEIPGLLEDRFVVSDHRNLGGTLLSPLFYELVANLEISRPGDSATVGLVAALEESLIARGELHSDYQFWVLEKTASAFVRRRPEPREISGLGLESVDTVRLQPPELFSQHGGSVLDAAMPGGFLNRLIACLSPWHRLEASGFSPVSSASQGFRPDSELLLRSLDPWLTSLQSETPRRVLDFALPQLSSARAIDVGFP